MPRYLVFLWAVLCAFGVLDDTGGAPTETEGAAVVVDAAVVLTVGATGVFFDWLLLLWEAGSGSRPVDDRLGSDLNEHSIFSKVSRFPVSIHQTTVTRVSTCMLHVSCGSFSPPIHTCHGTLIHLVNTRVSLPHLYAQSRFIGTKKNTNPPWFARNNPVFTCFSSWKRWNPAWAGSSCAAESSLCNFININLIFKKN